MMAHVAEASEAKGRVLLLIEESAHLIEPAAYAASRFAAAFHAEIETIIVNLDSAERAQSLDTATVVPALGADLPEATSMTRIAEVQHLAARRHRRVVDHVTRRQGVVCRHTSLDGDAVDRLSEVCASRGPWNIVVLAGEASLATASAISTIFANVGGATGIVTTPPRLVAAEGPVVLAVEDAERFPAMLRAASRLKSLCGRVHVVIAADKRADAEKLESHVRLATPNHAGLLIEPVEPLFGVEGGLDEKLRQLKASFVIARFGGTLLPAPRILARTVSVVASPFLLVR